MENKNMDVIRKFIYIKYRERMFPESVLMTMSNWLKIESLLLLCLSR